MTSELIALRDIISSSVDQIVDICEKTGKPFPSLNEPIQFSEFTPDGIRNDPKVLDAIGLIVAATTHLAAAVNPPPVTLTTSAFRVNTVLPSFFLCMYTNRRDILRFSLPCLLHLVLPRRRTLQKYYARLDSRFPSFFSIFLNGHFLTEVNIGAAYKRHSCEVGHRPEETLLV